jgi:hypothetical protein
VEEKERMRGVFVALLMIVLLANLYYFDYAYTPCSDFMAFGYTALIFLSFNLSSSYAHLPLYPGLIAILTPHLHTKYPTLHAAEGINFVLSIISLCLLSLISSRILNRGSYFVPIFFVIGPCFFYLSSQPLVEMTLLATILMTIYLDLKGSRWAYLGAFLASLSRYEAASLIPILVAKDLVYRKERLHTIILGLISSIGIGMWIILSILQHHEEINPYITIIRQHGLGGPVFLGTLLKSIAPMGGILSIAILFFMIIGLLALVRTSFKEIFSLLLFLVAYIGVHIVYPFGDVVRFTFPVHWILLIFVTKGVERTLSYLGRYNLLDKIPHPIIVSGSSILYFLLFMTLLYYSLLLRDRGVGLVVFIAVSILILWALFCFVKAKGWRKGFVLSGGLAILIYIVGTYVDVSTSMMEEARYANATHRAIAEWYAENVKEGDRLGMAWPWLVCCFSGLELRYFQPLEGLGFIDEESFISGLKNRGVTYIVWDDSGCNPCNSTFVEIPLPMFRLCEGRDLPHFKMVKRIEVGPKVAYIYKVIY